MLYAIVFIRCRAKRWGKKLKSVWNIWSSNRELYCITHLLSLTTRNKVSPLSEWSYLFVFVWLYIGNDKHTPYTFSSYRETQGERQRLRKNQFRSANCMNILTAERKKAPQTNINDGKYIRFEMNFDKWKDCNFAIRNRIDLVKLGCVSILVRVRQFISITKFDLIRV